VEAQRPKKRQNGISFGLFFMTIVVMSVVVSLSLIKIYLSTQIYYESRRVNYIQREVLALKEENIMLENQLQRQKFKNCVSDINFSMEIEELENSVEEGFTDD
jgi:cell division protein FtsL